MNNVRQFLDSGAGEELYRYLVGKLEELRDISKLKEIDTPTHQVIELKAAKRAHAKLKEILSEVMTFAEEGKKKDARDSFAI